MITEAVKLDNDKETASLRSVMQYQEALQQTFGLT